MICDLQNNQAPSSPEYVLMIPMIVAFKATSDKGWFVLAYKAHQWLYHSVKKIGDMRGWLVDDIYRGRKNVDMSAEHKEDGIIFTLYLDKFQFSQLELKIN